MCGIRFIKTSRQCLLYSCSCLHVPCSLQIMFLLHKKKKNLCWDMDTLTTWKHVSCLHIITPFIVYCVYILVTEPNIYTDTVQTGRQTKGCIIIQNFVPFSHKDPSRDTVSLSFCLDGSVQVLDLHLPDYSGVLADCLQGQLECAVWSTIKLLLLLCICIGHKDLSDSLPEIYKAYREYHFDEVYMYIYSSPIYYHDVQLLTAEDHKFTFSHSCSLMDACSNCRNSSLSSTTFQPTPRET